jgi:hypothetical protein
MEAQRSQGLRIVPVITRPALETSTSTLASGFGGG